MLLTFVFIFVLSFLPFHCYEYLLLERYKYIFTVIVESEIQLILFGNDTVTVTYSYFVQQAANTTNREICLKKSVFRRIFRVGSYSPLCLIFYRNYVIGIVHRFIDIIKSTPNDTDSLINLIQKGFENENTFFFTLKIIVKVCVVSQIVHDLSWDRLRMPLSSSILFFKSIESTF